MERRFRESPVPAELRPDTSCVRNTGLSEESPVLPGPSYSVQNGGPRQGQRRGFRGTSHRAGRVHKRGRAGPRMSGGEAVPEAGTVRRYDDGGIFRTEGPRSLPQVQSGHRLLAVYRTLMERNVK